MRLCYTSGMKYLFHWFLEFILVIIHFPLSILNYILPFHHRHQDQKKGTILLVERWFRRNPLHFLMKYYLESQGFETHSINLPLLEGTFKESGKRLKEILDNLPDDQFILVGISGGGLSCLEYLAEHNGWSRTKKFIAVGVPFHGAVASYLMPFSKPREELSPNSPYIQSVSEIKIINKDKIYCIAAKYDQMVGSENSFLDGTHKITIDMAGHNLIHTIWIPTWKKIAELSSLK